MSKASPGKYRKFAKEGKEYLNTQFDLLRLNLLDKTASVVSVLILVMIGMIILTSVWVYASFLLIMYMERAFQSFGLPVIIMGSVNILMLAIVIIFRERLILNPLIKIFSKVLFENSRKNSIYDEDEEDEDDED